eukprot:2270096-Pyramimonas_sp.AAC.1
MQAEAEGGGAAAKKPKKPASKKPRAARRLVPSHFLREFCTSAPVWLLVLAVHRSALHFGGSFDDRPAGDKQKCFKLHMSGAFSGNPHADRFQTVQSPPTDR